MTPPPMHPDAVRDFRARLDAAALAYAEADHDDRAALVADALEHGLPAQTPSREPTRRERLDMDHAVLTASGLFDAFGYFWHNRDLVWELCGHDEELRQFVRLGWRELRNPNADFDLWFYWSTHLDPGRDEVNPAVHYALEGRRAGLTTMPTVTTQPPPSTLTDSPRRICLFAGFDVDGVVDPTVVEYLADLSRFADVYYLADCPMEPGELEKLAPYTKQAWAIRHGRYDFGSYSMLAQDLVGWEVIEEYDELILANDSCWPVQSFEQVFAKMDATACDWWGLQATYEDFDTAAHERLGRSLTLEELTHAMREPRLWRYTEFVHVGSYFLACRAPVLRDPEFRRRLDTVARESDKTAIILKYEIGISRLLVLSGYHLATFVDGILPYHPVYRESAFELMRTGFPLLKRQLLYENPFFTPDLRLWKERVAEVLPDLAPARLADMEANLRRVSPSWSLHESFGIRTLPDGRVEIPEPPGPGNFTEEDRWSPSFDHWWVFPVDPHTGVLSGAVRAVFEEVAEDPTVKKIVLRGETPVRVSGSNVVVAATESPTGQKYALRAGWLFLSRGARSDVNHPLGGRHHRFVHLGDATGLAAPQRPLARSVDASGTRQLPPASSEDRLVARVVAASDEAATALRSRFDRLDEESIWITGSPRADLLLRAREALRAPLRGDLERLRAAVAGRRVVLVSPLRADDIDLEELAAGARARPELVVLLQPPGDVGDRLPAGLVDLADPRLVGDLDATVPVVPEMAWRIADVLVAGAAHDLADFAVLGRPAVATGSVAEGPLLPCRTTADVLAAIDAALEDGPDADYLAWGRRLHAHSDGHSAARVARRVRSTYLPVEQWLAELTPR